MTGDDFGNSSRATEIRRGRIQALAFVIGAGVCVLLCSCFAVSDFFDAGPGQKIELVEKINPNFAPVGSLVRLPGIGMGRAAAIVRYRDSVHEQGAGRAFTSCDDMQKVRGIGPVTSRNMGQWLEFE